MGTLGEIFKIVKEEFKKTKSAVAEQAPVVKAVLSEEAKELKTAAKEKGAEAKVVIKGSYLGAAKAVKEQMPAVKESLKEGAEEVKNFFSLKTDEEDAAAAAEAENAETADPVQEREMPADNDKNSASDLAENLSKMDTGVAGDVAEDLEDILNDISFIRDMKHTPSEGWNQYDFLLAAAPYGWDYILDSADYMVTADLGKIGTISLGRSLGGNALELVSDYKEGEPISSVKTLAIEGSTLGIGGISKVLKCPVKIVWINQTNTLRIFTLGLSDNMLLTKYAETLIRRTFGTESAMKMAKPCDTI